jgi:apolipoprotein D and lipocalin family protein
MNKLLPASLNLKNPSLISPNDILKANIMRKKHYIIGLLIFCCSQNWAMAQTEQKAVAPIKTIASLDIARYQGTWYEIAKFPNWFQRKCIADTNATYKIKEDGNVSVTNRCTFENNEKGEALGTARQIGDSTSPKLEVRFAPAWLGFLPLVWGDYWVIDIDPEYQLAAVSDPRREYLWILSRTKSVDQNRYQALLGRLVNNNGFSLEKLSLTPQN